MSRAETLRLARESFAQFLKDHSLENNDHLVALVYFAAFKDGIEKARAEQPEVAH